jgi:hypothetical protein
METQNSISMDRGKGSKHYFFSFFSNYRKNKKTIWELTNSQGNRIHGFQNVVSLGIDHFKGPFKELKKVKMDVILIKFSLYMILIDEYENEYMYHEITKE